MTRIFNIRFALYALSTVLYSLRVVPRTLRQRRYTTSPLHFSLFLHEDLGS